MGFLDFLFGPPAPMIADPEQLRQALFEAARQGNRRYLERLLRTNRQAVVQHFRGWQQVPEPLRNDRAALEGYLQSLVAIAQTFASRLGSQELMQALMGSEQDNPLVRWQQGLQRARGLIADLRHAEARELLATLLTEGRGMRGSGPERYLPITLGTLGQCHFEVGEAEKALPLLEEALQLCQQNADAEGVLAYLGNLYEAHRYLGRAEHAASYAARLAEAFEQFGRADEARRYRRQAAVVRAGEPLNRVVAVVDGKRYEMDEVPLARDRRVQFVFERNRITLRPVMVMTERGEEHGRAGRYDEALAAFRAAQRADPFDPHPHYQEGLTLLYLKRYAEAVTSYEATERLAPGWFHARGDLWLARQLADGRIDHETFLAVQVLEDGPAPPKDRVLMADQALTRAPHLALLHLLRGQNLDRLGKSVAAQEAYAEGLRHAAEPDVRSRLLVGLGMLLKDPAEREARLREAEALNGNLVAAASATVVLRTFAAGS